MSYSRLLRGGIPFGYAIGRIWELYFRQISQPHQVRLFVTPSRLEEARSWFRKWGPPSQNWDRWAPNSMIHEYSSPSIQCHMTGAAPDYLIIIREEGEKEPDDQALFTRALAMKECSLVIFETCQVTTV